MAFSDAQTTDLATVMSTDYFGETVTYAGSSVPAIVDRGENLADVSGGTEGARNAEARIWVRTSDVSAPAYRDAVVIDSVTWYVLRVVSGAGGMWTIDLFRDERPVI